jgi:hypothetical protein
VPVLPLSITLWPTQKVKGPDGVIVATGIGFTVIAVAADVTEHPLVLVTITE